MERHQTLRAALGWSYDLLEEAERETFDRLGLAFGGPTRIRNVTWFLSFQGPFDDGYLKTAERRPRQTILDFISVGPRQNNQVNLQGKLAWRIRPGSKLTLEMLRTNARLITDGLN